MTRMSTTAVTTTDQVMAGVAVSARRLAPPLLALSGFCIVLSVVAHVVLRWQGAEVTGPGTAGDGVWVGIEASADRVAVRGLDWLGVVGAGLVSFVLSAALPGMVFGSLAGVGITRRALAITGLVAVVDMWVFVAAVTAVTAAVTSDSVATWSSMLVSSGHALVTLGVLMTACLAVATAWLHGPLWGSVAMVTPVALVLLAGVLGILPSGPVMAAIVTVAALGAFLALVRRLPVR